MSTYNITIENIELVVDYDYTAPEPQVGFNGQLDINSIKIDGCDDDIYELIDSKHIKNIDSEIWNYER